MDITKLFRMVFTNYLAALLVICGIINGIIYPLILSDKKYPTEYKIGKYTGIAYLGLGVLMVLVSIVLS